MGIWFYLRASVFFHCMPVYLSFYSALCLAIFVRLLTFFQNVISGLYEIFYVWQLFWLHDNELANVCSTFDFSIFACGCNKLISLRQSCYCCFWSWFGRTIVKTQYYSLQIVTAYIIISLSCYSVCLGHISYIFHTYFSLRWYIHWELVQILLCMFKASSI